MLIIIGNKLITIISHTVVQLQQWDVDVGVVVDLPTPVHRERANHGNVVSAPRQLLEHGLESAEVAFQWQRQEHQHVGRVQNRGPQEQRQNRNRVHVHRVLTRTTQYTLIARIRVINMYYKYTCIKIIYYYYQWPLVECPSKLIKHKKNNEKN